MGKPQKRSASLQEYAVKLYEELQSGNAVARKLDLSPPTVYRMLADAGVSVPEKGSLLVAERRRKLSGESRDAVVAAYRDGKSLREIKAVFGAGQMAVYTALRDSGVPRREHGGQPKELSAEQREEIIRLAKDGWTQTQIAAKLGKYQGTVSRWMRKSGLVRRSGGPVRGGRAVTGAGYALVLAPKDFDMPSMINSSGYVMEHRLVMARALGRPLKRSESVHHVNGDKQDNRLENLQLVQGQHGKGICLKCRACGSHDVHPVPLQEA